MMTMVQNGVTDVSEKKSARPGLEAIARTECRYTRLHISQRTFSWHPYWQLLLYVACLIGFARDAYYRARARERNPISSCL